MNGSRRRETSKEKAKSRAARFGPKDHPGRKGRALLTTGSFEKPKPKGCGGQFKSLSHPPEYAVNQAQSLR